MPIPNRPRYAARLNAFRPAGGGTVADMIAGAGRVGGIDAADLNYPDHFARHRPGDLSRLLADNGMAVNGLAMRYYTEPGFRLGAFTHPDAGVRRTAIDLTKRGIDAGAEMGSRLMTLWLGQDGYDYPFQADYGRMWDDTVAAVAEVCDHVRDVDIAIEYKPNEPRAYALLPVFALLAMLGANRLLRAAEAAPGLPPISAQLLFAVGCAGLMHSHATGVFAVTALGLATLVGLAGAAAPRPALLRLIGAGAFAVLLAAPVLLAMAAQSGSANIGWMPKFGLDTPVIVNRYLLVGPMVRTDLGEECSRVELLSEMALGTVTALTLILMSLREIRAGRSRALLVVYPLLFVTLLALVSLARPVLIPRVALWVSVPICLAAAMVLTGRLAWWLRAAAGMLLAACIAVGLWNNVAAPAQHKPDWRALLAAQPQGIAGPVLVAGPHAGPLGIAFYADGPIMRKLHHWTPDPTLPVTTADRLERTTSGATPVDTAAIGDLIAAGQRVVLYLDDDDEILIGRHLEAQPWFAAARRGALPGLLLFEW